MFCVSHSKVLTTPPFGFHCSEVISWPYIDTRYQRHVVFLWAQEENEMLLTEQLSLLRCCYLLSVYFIYYPSKLYLPIPLFSDSTFYLKMFLAREVFLCFATGMGSGEALREWETKRNESAKKKKKMEK